MDEHPSKLGVQVAVGPDSDAEEIAEATLQLRRTPLNEPAHAVNLAVEEFFADRQPGDLLLMHFSGHGIKDQDGAAR